jgi:hypothetical protein
LSRSEPAAGQGRAGQGAGGPADETSGSSSKGRASSACASPRRRTGTGPYLRCQMLSWRARHEPSMVTPPLSSGSRSRHGLLQQQHGLPCGLARRVRPPRPDHVPPRYAPGGAQDAGPAGGVSGPNPRTNRVLEGSGRGERRQTSTTDLTSRSRGRFRCWSWGRDKPPTSSRGDSPVAKIASSTLPVGASAPGIPTEAGPRGRLLRCLDGSSRQHRHDTRPEWHSGLDSHAMGPSGTGRPSCPEAHAWACRRSPSCSDRIVEPGCARAGSGDAASRAL